MCNNEVDIIHVYSVRYQTFSLILSDPGAILCTVAVS